MMNKLDLEELEAELADFAPAEKKLGLSTLEERIVAGFEEIQRFYEWRGQLPQASEAGDIFERLYAVRLERLRTLEQCRILLEPRDHQGLLRPAAVCQSEPGYSPSTDELLSELSEVTDPANLTELHHVRPMADRQAPEEIASREKCPDFARFKPLFSQAEEELKSGLRQTRRFVKDASIEVGNFFILSGQFVYVAEVGETIKTANGKNDARLRVIYANGTQSNILRRSLQRALYKDDAGRRLITVDLGPLFTQTWDDEDIESGTIYVLRSLSDHPFVTEHRDLIHKIGVTGGRVETRIANAAQDATFLLANVEIVATYTRLPHFFLN
jgi:hypothetical protein